MKPARSFANSAFTLVELVLSMAVIALIVGTCMSVIGLTTRVRSIDAAGDSTSRTTNLRQAVDQIALELKSATGITASDSSSIAFQVPDRDGDGLPDSVTYSVIGNSLYRGFGSATPSPILGNVGTLTFRTTSKTATLPELSESTEQLLMSYTASPNTWTDLSTSNWRCQYFSPGLPPEAVSWKVTRVQLLVRRKSLFSAGTVTVELHAADSAYKSIGATMGTATVSATSIPLSNTWTDFTLATPVGELSPGTGFTMVVKSSAGMSNVTLNRVASTGTLLANAYESATSNAGSTWTAPTAAACLNFRVYGTVTTIP
ncbi:MAG: hypothetical protein QM770_05945 [Tepidisphaeraceae bacterium]